MTCDDVVSDSHINSLFAIQKILQSSSYYSLLVFMENGTFLNKNPALVSGLFMKQSISILNK